MMAGLGNEGCLSLPGKMRSRMAMRSTSPDASGGGSTEGQERRVHRMFQARAHPLTTVAKRFAGHGGGFREGL
jgi:hypothetical protein